MEGGGRSIEKRALDLKCMRPRACSLMLQNLLWKLVNMWAAAVHICMCSIQIFEGGGEIPPLAVCRKNPGLHIIVVGRCVKLMRFDNWVMCANPQMHGEVNDTCTSTKLEVWTVYTAYVYCITH